MCGAVELPLVPTDGVSQISADFGFAYPEHGYEANKTTITFKEDTVGVINVQLCTDRVLCCLWRLL